MSASNDLAPLRHTAAHLLAHAVVDLFGDDVQLAIGPAIDNGFYYDFLKTPPFVTEDLPRIESRMRELIAQGLRMQGKPIGRAEAEAYYTQRRQPFKLDILHGIPDGEPLTMYTIGDFTDLCRGGHVDSSAAIGAVKLLSIAGAYWRGDERNPMLQRIYGTAFPTDAELQEYLHKLEEAKRRDHRRVGKELELFAVSDTVGAGLPLWLPKGATIRRLLEEYILEREREQGYEHVYTPAIAKVDLYKRSGHWDHYQDSMFPPMNLETEQLVLRPMNCPHHIVVYESKERSYRELPLRIAELGTMYRYERSGVLSGLSRVRGMTLNDAHIFCTADQIKEEFSSVMRLVESTYRDLKITDYSYRLSLRDPANPAKYVDDDAMWELGERVLREAMDALGLPYTEAVGEAAFYGPKLDIQLADVMGHEETYSTIQVDFHLPNQFDLHYVAGDGTRRRPVIIHRAIVSTMERMISYLIELYDGAFPAWLAPVQAVVLPIADEQNAYAGTVAAELRAAGFRVAVDESNERLQKKIRNHQLQKVPYMLVVGKNEVTANSINLRTRSGEQSSTSTAEFSARLRAEVDARS